MDKIFEGKNFDGVEVWISQKLKDKHGAYPDQVLQEFEQGYTEGPVYGRTPYRNVDPDKYKYNDPNFGKEKLWYTYETYVLQYSYSLEKENTLSHLIFTLKTDGPYGFDMVPEDVSTIF